MTNPEAYNLIAERAEALTHDKEVQRKMLNIATAQGKKSAEKWLYMLAIASLCGCNKQC